MKHALGIYNITTTLDFNQDKEIAYFTPKKNIIIPNNLNLEINPDFDPFKEEKISFTQHHSSSSYKTIEVEQTIFTAQGKLFNDDSLNLFRLRNGYWIWDELRRTFLMDMHRIHQTVIYHKLLKKSFGSTSQKLMFALEYPISKIEYLVFESIKNSLSSFGFEIRLIEDMVYFDSLPSNFPQSQFYNFFDELTKNINEETYNDFSEFYFKVFIKVCAKKKNEFLNFDIVQSVIQEFKQLKMPEYNPFGKKNYVVVSLNELINQF